MQRSRVILQSLLVVLVLVEFSAFTVAQTSGNQDHWVATWVSAQQAPRGFGGGQRAAAPAAAAAPATGASPATPAAPAAPPAGGQRGGPPVPTSFKNQT